jgi:ribosomal protein L23
VAAYKPWTDKAYLYKMYVTQRKTIDQIAADVKETYGLSVTSMTVYNNLKKHDLIKNGRTLGKRTHGGTGKRGGFY